MSELKSDFSRVDIETLIDSMNDWETLGNHEFHLLHMVKNAPMPPEDHEAYEMMQSIKDHFRNREKDIRESRVVRQEKATFLKAKLMMVRKDIGIDELFNMAASVDATLPGAPAKKERVPQQKKPKLSKEQKNKLELAEFFIRDLGVWNHYTDFLADREESPQSEDSEKSE